MHPWRRELTGKNSGTAAQWEDLASVLVTELKIAAGRTAVSSVPAFLAEHLRRRLWKLDKGREIPSATGGGGPEGHSEQVAAITGDISKCPDCFGAGMFYPEGFEKGVAKCKHDNLPPG